MKTRFTIFLLLAVLATGCNPFTPVPVIPELSITAVDEYFVNGTASFRLSLTNAAETDVIVNLKLGASTLEASRVGFPSTVTIEAGNKVATVSVTADDSDLDAGEYTVVLSIANAGGATVSEEARSASFKLLVSIRNAVVSLSGGSAFTDGKARILLTPSFSPQGNINISLAAGDASEGKKAIPADAISFPSSVVLPKGKTDATEVTVTLDMDKITPGEYETVIRIDGISGPGTIGEAKQAVFSAQVPLTARQQNSWSARYRGLEQNGDGVLVSNFDVRFVPGYSYGYYFFQYSGGYVRKYYTSMEDFLKDEEAEVAKYIGTDDPYVFETEASTQVAFWPLQCGSYDFYMLGCDRDGHLTGEYHRLEMEIWPTQTMVSAYDGWLGTWASEWGDTWTIREKDRSVVSYSVSGSALSNFEVEAVLGPNGELVFYGGQKLATNLYLAGIFPRDGSTYFTTASRPFAESSIQNNERTHSTLSGVIADRGSEFQAIMGYNYATGKSEFIITLPSELYKVESLRDTDPVWGFYSDYTGTWSYNGYSISISSSQDKYGEEYIVYGLRDQDYFVDEGHVKARYSEGKMYLEEQDIESYNTGYGSDAIATLSGLFKQSGFVHPHYPDNWNSPGYTICDFSLLSNGQVALTPWLCSDGTPFTGMCFSLYIPKIGIYPEGDHMDFAAGALMTKTGWHSAPRHAAEYTANPSTEARKSNFRARARKSEKISIFATLNP